MANALYFGDNLEVLRESIKDESIDLIYLDPPFNSNATYNVLFRTPKGHQSDAQIEAFDDTWHWGEQAEAAFADLMQQSNTDVAEVTRALRSVLGENDMMAYLTMMAVRLLELRRVLRPTGSLYLHCDPTASRIIAMRSSGNELARIRPPSDGATCMTQSCFTQSPMRWFGIKFSSRTIRPTSLAIAIWTPTVASGPTTISPRPAFGVVTQALLGKAATLPRRDCIGRLATGP